MRLLSKLGAVVGVATVGIATLTAPAFAAPTSASANPITAEGHYVAVTPNRILDTRTGNGSAVQKIGPNSSIHLQVTGRGGIPTSGVSAVVLNVTATGGTSGSYLTAWPTGVTRPTASNLNFPAGWTGANSVTVPLGTDGKIDIYNSLGSVDVIADTLGYYTNATGTGGGLYQPFEPFRAVDTRDYGVQLGKGQTLDVWFGIIGEPNAGSFVKAVAVNITAVNGTGGGYVTSWNGVDQRPNASTLNYGKNQVVPNFTIVPTVNCPAGKPASCAGKPFFSIYNDIASSVDIIVDVVGFYDDGSYYPDGFQFKPVTPTRIADSRSNLGFSKIGQNQSAIGTLPAALQSGYTWGVVSNLTGILPSKGTYLSVFDASAPSLPEVSNLNLSPGEVRPNAALFMLDEADQYKVYNAQGTVDVAIDVSGTWEYVWNEAAANAQSTAGNRASYHRHIGVAA